MKKRLLIQKMWAFLIMAALLLQFVAMPAETASAAVKQTGPAGRVVKAIREGVVPKDASSFGKEKGKLDFQKLAPSAAVEAPMAGALKGKDLTGDREFTQLVPGDISAQWHENTIPAFVVDEDMHWDGYAGVITGDLYVAPDSILLITGDALLQGDLYNYGLVIVQGVLEADCMYSNNYFMSLQEYYWNGDLMLDETYSSGLLAYDYHLITDIESLPIAMYSDNLVNNRGYLPLLQGAILPLFDLEIEYAPIPLFENGSFTIENYYAGRKPALQIDVYDYFDQKFSFSYELEQLPYVEPSVNVLAGSNRFRTAQLVSSAMYDQANTAILVRADDYPDALAAGPLAYAWDAPILLTATDQLHTVTRQELSRLGVSKVILMGGPLSISDNVEAELKSSYVVERIAGGNRYTTAIKAANLLKEYWGSPSTIVITSGVNFPDALAAGSYAAANGYPLILSNGQSVQRHDLDFIETNRVNRVILMGSSNVISSAIEDLLKNRGLTVERIAGATRAQTAAVMAGKYFAGSTQAVVANGWTFADALTAIPYAASLNAPILLVRNDFVELAVKNYLKNSNVHTITVIGGDQVVSPAVRTTLLDSIR